MRTFLEVRPIQLTDEEIVHQYLAKNKLVAIRRDLAEDLASPGGIASHLVVYDRDLDRYVWRISVKEEAV